MALIRKQAFVCYARKDEQFVLPLAANLQKRGCSLWVNRWDIPLGANWDRTVDRALKSCRVFLFVMSPNAVNSPEVEGELRTALYLHKYIVPVLYRNCEIPRALRSTQYVDFSHGNPNHEASLQQLIETLKYWNTVLLGHPPIPDFAPHRPPRGINTRAGGHTQAPGRPRRTSRGNFDAASPTARDPVDCTVFAPQRAALGEQVLIQAFVHRPEQTGELED